MAGSFCNEDQPLYRGRNKSSLNGEHMESELARLQHGYTPGASGWGVCFANC